MRSPAAPTFNSRAKEWSSVESGFCSMDCSWGLHIESCSMIVVKCVVEERAFPCPSLPFFIEELVNAVEKIFDAP
jgi:hypothetical protein